MEVFINGINYLLITVSLTILFCVQEMCCCYMLHVYTNHEPELGLKLCL
jgi:hypothetical protein